jgi:hypothetical protein
MNDDDGLLGRRTLFPGAAALLEQVLALVLAVSLLGLAAHALRAGRGAQAACAEALKALIRYP